MNLEQAIALYPFTVDQLECLRDPARYGESLDMLDDLECRVDLSGHARGEIASALTDRELEREACAAMVVTTIDRHICMETPRFDFGVLRHEGMSVSDSLRQHAQDYREQAARLERMALRCLAAVDAKWGAQ